MTEAMPSFTPNWVSPPGETILDLLEEHDWTQEQLAQRLGYSTKHVSLLIELFYGYAKKRCLSTRRGRSAIRIALGM